VCTIAVRDSSAVGPNSVCGGKALEGGGAGKFLRAVGGGGNPIDERNARPVRPPLTLRLGLPSQQRSVLTKRAQSVPDGQLIENCLDTNSTGIVRNESRALGVEIATQKAQRCAREEA